MKKMTLKNTLMEVSQIRRNMPRTINEALDMDPSMVDSTYTEEEAEPVDGTDAQASNEVGAEAPVEQPMEQPTEQPVEQPAEQPAVNNTMNPGVANVPEELRTKVAKFVDSIRKMSLKGMSDLADYPNSGEYELLKKLWQTTDKKPESKGQGTL